MREIPGALTEAMIVVDARPVLAAVVGTEQAAIERFDKRVYAVAVAPRDRNADAPEQALGQPVAFDALPRCAAVGRAKQPAARTAARQTPRRASRFPECGEQDVGIRRVEADVNPPGLFVPVEHL